MKTIFLDLDGVLVDLDQQFIKHGGIHWFDLPALERWNIINKAEENKDLFFLNAPITPYGENLFKNISQFCEKNDCGLEILTSTGLKNTKRIEAEKIIWVIDNLSPYIKVNFSKTGEGKHEYIGSRTSNNPCDYLLIDDNKRNCEWWENHGGTTVLWRPQDSSIFHLTYAIKTWIEN